MFADDTTVLFVCFAGISHFGHIEGHVVSDFVDLLVIGVVFEDFAIELEHFFTCFATDFFVFCLFRQELLLFSGIASGAGFVCLA